MMAGKGAGVAAAAVAVGLLAGCGSAAPSTAPLGGPVSASPVAGRAAPDGKLTLGTLVPQTGPLAFLGPAQAAGVRLAVQRINAAGGVLGSQVDLVEGDAGAAGADTARHTVDREVAVGVDAVVGPPTSEAAAEVVPAAAAAQLFTVSPSATAAGLTSARFSNLFARTVAADTAQAHTVAALLAADRRSNVCVLSTGDDYGHRMAEAVAAALPADRAPKVVFYDPAGSDFAGPAGQCAAGTPDAVVLVGVESARQVVAALAGAGLQGGSTGLYLTDGGVSAATFDGAPAGLRDAAKGVVPGAEADAAFTQALHGVDPHLASTDFAAEAYDAATVIALASLLSHSDAGPRLAAALPEVSPGKAGAVACASFADCAAAVAAGKAINYQGVSGPVDFTAQGQPATAPVGVYVFDAAGPKRVSTMMSPTEPVTATAPTG